jgi:hypothetical protein
LHYFHGIGLVVGTQNEMRIRHFEVLDGASALFKDGVHVRFVAAIRLQRIVVTVQKHSGSRQKARVHAHALVGVDPNHNKAFPGFPVTLGLGPKAAQEGAAEFQQFFNAHAHDERLSSGDFGIHQKDVIELAVSGRGNTSPLVDFFRTEKIEDGEALHLQDPVHALQTETAFAVEEVGDVGLFEAGFFRQTKTGQLAVVDTLPQALTEVLLQALELHDGGSIAGTKLANSYRIVNSNI